MSVPVGLYSISNAQILQDGGDEIIIVSEKTTWMAPVLGGIGLAVLGFLMLITREILFILLGLMAFSGAFFLLNNMAYTSRAVIKLATQEIAYSARYLLRAPRIIDFSAPLTDLVYAGFRGGQRPSKSIVDLVFRNGMRLVIDFGARSADAAQAVQRLKSIDLPEPQEADFANAAARAAFFGPQIEMQQRLRTWSVWMFIMAVVQLVSGAFSPWALLLIAIGGASFYFRVAAMFIMYAVIIGWAGVSNLLFTDAVMWKGFAFLQAYWAYQLVNEFRRYHRIERFARTHPEEENHAGLNEQTTRAGRFFPWIALIVGLGALGVFGFSFLGIVGAAFMGSVSEQVISVLGELEVSSLFLALLGLSVGLAGWASGYPWKGASIVGTVASAATIIAVVALILLGG